LAYVSEKNIIIKDKPAENSNADRRENNSANTQKNSGGNNLKAVTRENF